MSRFARVARIAKTKNLEGSVVAQAADSLPFLLREGLDVHFVPPSLSGPRQARVGAIREIKEGSFEVDFEGISSIDDAETIVGCYCLADRAQLEDGDGGMPYVDAIGWQVHDADLGDLGVVCEIVENPSQMLFVVDGPRGEVLIPAVAEFISAFDENARVVEVNVPTSLLSLN